MILTRLPRGRFANLYGDDSIMGPEYPEDLYNGTSGSTGNNGWDGSTIAGLVSSVVGSLSGMFGSIFGGAGNKNQNQTTDTISGAGQTYIPAQKSSNNTWVWILLAVILVVIVLLVLKKRKK